MTTMKTMATMRNLEVVHKEVGGCLNSYNLQLDCVYPQGSYKEVEDFLTRCAHIAASFALND